MAGDWIKMRTDLYRDPKICVMADLLMDAESELSRFVNHNKRRDMTVTRNVTRCACVGALLSVWGVLRHRGKREDDDLVCLGVTLAVIDDISDIPGFGDVMQRVGWADQREDGITLPRFFSEYNADPQDAQKSKAAERQARYRQKSVAQQGVTRDVTSDVTRDVTVTDRIEKNREENTASAVLVVADATEPKPKRKQFVPPTVEEVRAYCQERGNQIDPERFVDTYASQGWKKANGVAVVDWKGCVRTWEKNDAERRGGAGQPGQVAIRPAVGNTGGGLFASECNREAGNNAVFADYLQRTPVHSGNVRVIETEADNGVHERAVGRLGNRSPAVPGEGAESVGRGTGNVTDAVSGASRPIPGLPVEDASQVFPEFG